MYLQVKIKENGIESSDLFPAYITTKSCFLEQIKNLKFKFRNLNFKNNSINKLDGSIELNISIEAFGQVTSIIGIASKISDFKVIKSSLKCEKCNFSLLNLNDIIPNSISKDPEELKEYIGSVCQSCNSGRLYLFI